MAGLEVQLPRFNFLTGKREPGTKIQLGPDQVLLIEGIHGLNPGLVPSVPRDRVFRIYISALTQLNIDRYNRVPTTDNRLIRRIVRDARDARLLRTIPSGGGRACTVASANLSSLTRRTLTSMFNSALVYELSALKPFAEPLLHQIEPGQPGYIEAKRLLAFLQWFEPVPADPIPDNLILREFIGGGILERFGPQWGKT